MRAENHPWWKLAVDRANATGTKGESYWDLGLWATVVYQTTGDLSYAAKAITKALTAITGLPVLDRTVPLLPRDANYVREHFVDYIWMYEWLYPAMSDDQRAAYVQGLRNWCDWSLAIGTPQYVGGFRVTDSDQASGQYFGIALTDLLTGSDYLTRKDNTAQHNVIGGLDATAANFTSTVRNALARFVQGAEGGCWIESSEYNTDTPRLWMMGCEAIKSLTGVDHFPEFTAFLPQFAQEMIAVLTPDLKDSFQWGDDENPHLFLARMFHRITTLGMLQGLLQDTPIGGTLLGLIQELQAKYGYVGNNSVFPWPRIFLYYNPYAWASTDWRADAPKVLYAPGMGQLKVHDGWSPSDAFFAARMSTRTGVDHEVQDFGDFQLYRKGEWVLGHPIGYAQGPTYISNSNVVCNSMLIGGLSSMFMRGVVAQGSGDGFFWITGTTKGFYYQQPHYLSPPVFCREWTRSLVYAPAVDKSGAVVLVLDYVDADDPKSLPGVANYRPDDLKLINAAPSPKQWIIHSPVPATIGPDLLSWSTPGGQSVQVIPFLPLGWTATAYDETVLWQGIKEPVASERKFQTRICPGAIQPVDTFLNVISVFDSKGPTPPSFTLVKAPDPAMLAVRLVRPNARNLVVTFGADHRVSVQPLA